MKGKIKPLAIRVLVLFAFIFLTAFVNHLEEVRFPYKEFWWVVPTLICCVAITAVAAVATIIATFEFSTKF